MHAGGLSIRNKQNRRQLQKTERKIFYSLKEKRKLALRDWILCLILKFAKSSYAEIAKTQFPIPGECRKSNTTRA